MALRIWLPLNGSLENKGISDVTVTNNGATVDNNGKIGKCYSFGTSASKYLSIPKDLFVSHTGAISFSFWVQFLTWNTNYATVFMATSTSASWANEIIGFQRNGSNSNCTFHIGDDSSSTTNACLTSNLTLNQWYHFSLVYSPGNMKIYQDGILTTNYNTSIVPKFSAITNFLIGVSRVGTYQANMNLNDFRIYDHALSAKEVKEISQGLILHYKLDDNFISSNGLLLNGDGSLGTSYWSNDTVMSSSDLPIGSNARVNFKGGSYTELIPVVSDHSYTVSAFAKTAGATTGNWYPSIYPYDVDKNFIDNIMTPDGFRPSTVTTLARDLNPGDTVIYATNLSSWNTGSGHYGNYCAIFGYQDSTGYTYPDLVYTRTIPAFGSSTNAKTNINQSNNTITLNSAYSGRVCPAGTTICQSNDGNTYYYPWGNVALASIQDWTFKTVTIVPKDTNRLKAAKYFRWSNGGSVGLLADIKIIDDTFSDSENLIVSLLSGGQTSVSGLKVTTSGVNGDTYFRANLKRPLKAGEVYTISCVASGINDGEYFTFPIGSQINSSIAFVIKNGYNEYTFIANSVCETNPLMFDDNRRPSTPTVCTINNLYLRKASKIKDSSGYGHDGLIYKYDSTGSIVYTDDENGRYNGAFYVNSENNTTNTAAGTCYIYGNCELTNPSQMSVAFWCKPIAGYGNSTAQGQFCTTTYAYGNSNIGSDYQASAMNHRDAAIDINDSSGTTQCRPRINFIKNEWHHYAVTYDGQTGKTYKDGVLVDSAAFSAAKTLDSFIGVVIGFSKAGGVWRSNKSYFSDFRLYATALSAEDILDLYHTSANIDNLGGVHGFELKENNNNIAFLANNVIAEKDWNASTLLKSYTQSNCQVTLTDDGLRVYRPPNVNPTDNGYTMWGGMRLTNTSDGGKHIYNSNDNKLNLMKGHTYIITLHVKGKSSNASENIGWINQMGWGGGGLQPSPSNVDYDLIPSDFNGEKICWYKWTINDDIVKTCTTSYSYAVAGNKYLSYADFAFGWSYQNTGSMGTDIYITNIQLYDITNIPQQQILQNGVLNFQAFQENETNIAKIYKNNVFLSNNFIEK